MDLDWYMTILRYVHILFAIVILGSVAYNVLFLQPALMRLDPSVQRPAMLAIGPRVAVGILVSAAVVLLTGILMVLDVLGTSDLDRLFNTDWGLAVSAGFLISAVMFGIGLIYVIRNIFRMRSMALAGTPPTPEQAMRMQKQMRYGSMVALAFGIVAVLAMVMARGYNP